MVKASSVIAVQIYDCKKSKKKGYLGEVNVVLSRDILDIKHGGERIVSLALWLIAEQLITDIKLGGANQGKLILHISTDLTTT
jgi:hypothetical protein